jgi:hypothetical protein
MFQVAVSDLHKQTLAEHRKAAELAESALASSACSNLSISCSNEIDEARRQRNVVRRRKEQWQLDFVKVPIQ